MYELLLNRQILKNNGEYGDYYTMSVLRRTFWQVVKLTDRINGRATRCCYQGNKKTYFTLNLNQQRQL